MKNEVSLIESKAVSIMPSASEWSQMKEMAAIILKTGFLPNSVKTQEQALTIALKGRELGVPMMQSFSHINVIQGKPCISSELMMALIYKNCATAVIHISKSDEQECVIHVQRAPRDAPSTFKFSMNDAKAAELLGKDNWKKHPAAMLRARAISAMARAIFPDAIMGCSYTPEELGAVVNDDGEVIDVTPSIKHVEPPQHQQSAAAPVSAGEYVAQVGSLKDKKLKDIPSSEIFKTLDWIDNKATKPIGGKLIEFKKYAEQYLDSLEKTTSPSGLDKDIPF